MTEMEDDMDKQAVPGVVPSVPAPGEAEFLERYPRASREEYREMYAREMADRYGVLQALNVAIPSAAALERMVAANMMRWAARGAYPGVRIIEPWWAVMTPWVWAHNVGVASRAGETGGDTI